MSEEGSECDQVDCLSAIVSDQLPESLSGQEVSRLLHELETQEDGTVIERREESDRVVIVEINRGGVVRETTTPSDPNLCPSLKLREATSEDYIRYGLTLLRQRDGPQQYITHLGIPALKSDGKVRPKVTQSHQLRALPSTVNRSEASQQADRRQPALSV